MLIFNMHKHRSNLKCTIHEKNHHVCVCFFRTDSLRLHPHYAGGNPTITGRLWLVFRKSRAGKTRDYRDVIVFKKLLTAFCPHKNAKWPWVFSNSSGLNSVFEELRFQNVFRPHLNGKRAFSKSFGLKSVFEELRVQNVFRPHLNAKPAVSKSFRLKSVFEKFSIHDGLVWTVGLYCRNKIAWKANVLFSFTMPAENLIHIQFLFKTSSTIVTPPNSNTFSDWRRTCHVALVQTYKRSRANKTH